MRWQARWHDTARIVPSEVRRWATGRVTVSLSGRSVKPIARLLDQVPGLLEAHAVWPTAPIRELVQLLSMTARLQGLDVLEPPHAQVSWRPPWLRRRDRVGRAGWRRWMNAWPVDGEVLVWEEQGRAHRAWQTTNGATVLTRPLATGDIEWTVHVPDRAHMPWDRLWPSPGPGRVGALLGVPRVESGVPGPSPYFVDRWHIGWSGHVPGPLVFDLAPSWQGDQRWELMRSDGTGEASVRCGYGDRPAVHRVLWEACTMPDDRGIIRRFGQLVPGEDTWWSEPAPAGTPNAWFRSLGERARAYNAAALLAFRDAPKAGSTTPRAGHWQRWPFAGRLTALWSHPNWPEQAWVVYHRGQGPYPDRLSVRWGLTGPHHDYTLGRETARSVMDRLHRSEAVWMEWWEQMARVQDFGP